VADVESAGHCFSRQEEAEGRYPHLGRRIRLPTLAIVAE
jgi:hypothetical protein